MRICIPTGSKEGMKAEVYGHFGSAPYFTVFDTDNRTSKIIDNANAHHAHGMCHPLTVLGASSIHAVVCQGMGARALQKLNEAGIRVFRADGQNVSEVIGKWQANQLDEITPLNACAQHGCP